MAKKNNNDILVGVGFELTPEQIKKLQDNITKSITKTLKTLQKEMATFFKSNVITIPVQADFSQIRKQMEKLRSEIENKPLKIKTQVEQFTRGGTGDKRYKAEPGSILTEKDIAQGNRWLERRKQQLRDIGKTEGEIAALTKQQTTELQKMEKELRNARVSQEAAVKLGAQRNTWTKAEITNLAKQKVLYPDLLKSIKEINFQKEKGLKIDQQVATRTYSSFVGPQLLKDSKGNDLMPVEASIATPTSVAQGIERQTQALAAKRKELVAGGVSEERAIQVTKQYEKEINSASKALEKLNAQLAYNYSSQSGYQTPGTLNASQANKLNNLSGSLNTVGKNISTVSVEQERLAEITKKTDDYMKSFGFNIGIIGFGLGILGGTLQGLSQMMAQFVTESAKAIEPLERLRNLLEQDNSISPDRRDFIFSELNRLSDLPGADLDSVTKTFRSLRTLNLELEDTIKLVEGLTVATGRSGIGAEGLDRIAVQLRDFASTGTLRTQEVRSIISAGGTDVSNIIQKIAGGTTAADINRVGFSKFMPQFIAELNKLPRPLESTSDKLNRLANSFTRIRLDIMSVLKPGLDNLLGYLRELEPLVKNLVDRFNALPQSTKNAFSNLLIALPIVAGALGTILTTLGSVALGLAVFKQSAEGLSILKGVFSKAFVKDVEVVANSFTTLGEATETVATTAAKAGNPIRSLNGLLSTMFGTLAKGGGSVIEFFRLFAGAGGAAGGVVTIVSSLSKIPTLLGPIIGGLAKVLGLTNPIGWAVNALIGLLTNAGNSRNNLVQVFKSIGAEFSRLFENISDFFNTSFGQGLLEVINTLIDLISGTFGNAVVAILSVFKDMLSIVNDIIDALQGEDVDFTKFQEKVLNVMTAGVVVLGELMAASFLDYLQSKGSNIAKYGGFLGTLAMSGQGSRVAQVIRDRGLGSTSSNESKTSVNKGTTANLQNTVYQYLSQFQSDFRLMSGSLNQFDKSIDDATKRTNELVKASTDLTNAFKKSASDLQNTIRQQNLQFARTLEEREFSRLAERDPRAALASLTARQSSNLSAQIDASRQSAQSEIRNLDIESVLKELTSRRSLFIGSDIDQATRGIVGKLYENLVNSLEGAVEHQKAGTLSDNGVKVLQQIYDRFVQEVSTLGTSDIRINPAYGSVGNGEPRKLNQETLRDQANEATSLFSKALELGNAVIDANSKAAESEVSITAEIRAQTDQRKDMLEEALKLEAAEKRAQALRVLQFQEQEELNNLRDLESQQLEKDNFVSLDLQERIRASERQILQYDKEIADTLNIRQNAQRALEVSHENALRRAEREAELERERLETIRQIIQARKEEGDAAIENLQTMLSDSRNMLDSMSDIPGMEAFVSATSDVLDNVSRLQDILSEPLPIKSGNLVEILDSVKGIGKVGGGTNVIDSLRSGISVDDYVIQSLVSATEEIAKGLTRSRHELKLAQDNLNREIAEQASGISIFGKDRIVELTEAVEMASRAYEQYAQSSTFVDKALQKINKSIKDSIDLKLLDIKTLQSRLQWDRETLDLQRELLEVQNENNFRLLSLRGASNQAFYSTVLRSNTRQRELENKARENEYKTRLANLKLLEEETVARIQNQILTGKSVEAVSREVEEYRKLVEQRRQLLTSIYQKGVESTDESGNPITLPPPPKTETEMQLQGINGLTEAYRRQHETLNQLRESTIGFYDSLANGEYFLDSFQGWLMGSVSTLDMFKDMAKMAFAQVGHAISQGIISFFKGEDAAKSFGAALGDLLISLGEMIIQMAVAAPVVAFFRELPIGGFWKALAAMAATVPIALAGIGIGGAMILAGAALGGGGAASSTSSTNTANAANASTGAQNDFDANSDPRTVYAQALQAQVTIDIRSDDSQIVETVIKHVNQNGRLTRLIGNRTLNFGTM